MLLVFGSKKATAVLTVMLRRRIALVDMGPCRPVCHWFNFRPIIMRGFLLYDSYSYSLKAAKLMLDAAWKKLYSLYRELELPPPSEIRCGNESISASEVRQLRGHREKSQCLQNRCLPWGVHAAALLVLMGKTVTL